MRVFEGFSDAFSTLRTTRGGIGAAAGVDIDVLLELKRSRRRPGVLLRFSFYLIGRVDWWCNNGGPTARSRRSWNTLA
jgi:hypothetical protein